MHSLKFFTLVMVMLCLESKLVQAQEHETLDWNFFSNDKPRTATDQAFTWSTLSYRYRILDGKNNIPEFKFDVVSRADPDKSYFEKSRRLAKDLVLLKHEQGHADIVYIAAVKLKKELEQTSFSIQNVEEKSGLIFDKILLEMQQEQKKYDVETNHSNNRKAQLQWNAYFKKMIEP